MSDQSEIEQIHSAINQITGGFCTKWALVADVTDPETGTNQLHTAHAEGIALWDLLGLLRFAERLSELKIEAPSDEEDQ